MKALRAYDLTTDRRSFQLVLYVTETNCLVGEYCGAHGGAITRVGGIMLPATATSIQQEFHLNTLRDSCLIDIQSKEGRILSLVPIAVEAIQPCLNQRR